MSGTGSLGPVARMQSTQTQAMTTGNLMNLDRGVINRKQEPLPLAQLQPVTQPGLQKMGSVGSPSAVQQHYATSGQQQTASLKMKRPASRDPNY